MSGRRKTTTLMFTRLLAVGFTASCLFAQSGPDQTKPGAGNAAAAALAADSAFVQSSFQFLQRQINRIQDANTRFQTADAFTNPGTCVATRIGIDDAKKDAILKTLQDQELVNPPDASSINGGLKAGVFPALINENSPCPTLPMPEYAAPGGATFGHHSYPGGLMIHEVFNSVSSMNLANGYRRVYGTSTSSGTPVAASQDVPLEEPSSDIFISQDLMVAAPIWHDWAKSMVFQWTAEGTEFTELSFGGNGRTDAWGAAGDSRTGAHHIITIAEMMKRGLAPELVITMASAHSNPTSGNEYKVVNWLRAASILAQIDPVAQGFLYTDAQGRLRLPQLRQLGGVDLLAGSSSLSHTNTLAEYVLHNISDSDFTLTGPAVTEIQSVLASVASRFGFNPSDAANYNNKFRNKVLAYISAERLLILYGNGGPDAVAAEINKFKSKLTN